MLEARFTKIRLLMQSTAVEIEFNLLYVFCLVDSQYQGLLVTVWPSWSSMVATLTVLLRHQKSKVSLL